MQQFVFVPLIVIVVAVLVWTWWSGRSARDPVSSVDSFNRALVAMQPTRRADAETVEPPVEADEADEAEAAADDADEADAVGTPTVRDTENHPDQDIDLREERPDIVRPRA